MGQADDLATQVPPVIERAAQERVRGYGELAAREGSVLVGERDLPDEGWFCAPDAGQRSARASRRS